MSRDRSEHIEPYRWKPGQSGNPGGRPRRRPITDLLLEALSEIDEGGKSVARSIVESWIAEAVSGSPQHLRELLERVEGRVPDASPADGAGPGVGAPSLDPAVAARVLAALRADDDEDADPAGAAGASMAESED